MAQTAGSIVMSETNFQRIVSLLNSAEVEFVVIGGLAATIHGSAYLTYDLDVCYERSPANVERLCRALSGAHPTLRDAPKGIPFQFDSRTVLAGLNFTLDTDLGALDLLGEIAPLGEYSRVAEQSEVAELFGMRVRVLSLDALIQAKQAAGRQKDLLVIPELEALQELKKRPPE